QLFEALAIRGFVVADLHDAHGRSAFDAIERALLRAGDGRRERSLEFGGGTRIARLGFERVVVKSDAGLELFSGWLGRRGGGVGGASGLAVAVGAASGVVAGGAASAARVSRCSMRHLRPCTSRSSCATCRFVSGSGVAGGEVRMGPFFASRASTRSPNR